MGIPKSIMFSLHLQPLGVLFSFDHLCIPSGRVANTLLERMHMTDMLWAYKFTTPSFPICLGANMRERIIVLHHHGNFAVTGFIGENHGATSSSPSYGKTSRRKTMGCRLLGWNPCIQICQGELLQCAGSEVNFPNDFE